LEPGQWLTVNEGRIEKHGKFYVLPAPTSLQRSTEETIAALDDTLRETVRSQLVSDVPVAAFLSGGVDSSTVVALATQMSAEKLECFTIRIHDDSAQDREMAADLHYARRVAAHLGVPLHEVPVESSTIQRNLEWMVEQLDEPQADPACLNAHYICRYARERGYKVMLSGTGGDDVFSGYRRHTALHNEAYWAWLPRAARRGLSAVTAQSSAHNTLRRRLAKAFQYADCDPIDRLVSYFFWTHPAVTASLLPDLQVDVAEPLKSALAERRDIRAPLDQMLFLETRFFLGDHNLPYTDKMSMANGVEVRVPLIDTEVVKLAATIPTRLKQHGQKGKWILKQTAARYLPREVLTRPKAGFGVPLRQWMTGPLKTWTDDLLSPASVRSTGLFEPSAVRAIQTQNQQGRADGTYTLFALICATLWHQKFVALR
jgi:asparagine synthase (glutamine-hydrolysing)